MTQVPPSGIFTRRVCLHLEGMDDVTVRRDVAYGPPDGRLGMDVYYPPDQTDDDRWPAVINVAGDRKSTRLNSSHVRISYAVFCLKKKSKSPNSGWIRP